MNNWKDIAGITPVKKIDEGAQGEIWHVRKSGRDLVLKKYHAQSASTQQQAVIENLIQVGAPATVGHRFAWPLETVMDEDNVFIGYLMPLIDLSNYISFEQIETGEYRHPGFRILSITCRQLAECFRELHIKGLCYGDISKNNFLFSPETGDVVICDNDNVVVDRSGITIALGTPEYMAPEIVRNEAKPSTVTDQHALSVLLFILLCAHNPFHGEMEYNIRVFNGDASEYLYGNEAVFVFDSADTRNQLPDIPGYQHPKTFWNILPSRMQTMFSKAFIQGSHNPTQRITAKEWIEVFQWLEKQCCTCSCGMELFHADQKPCWNCGALSSLMLYVDGCPAVPIEAGRQLGDIGEIEKHPHDESLYLLRNRTNHTWLASFEDQVIDVPPQRAVSLPAGTHIQAGEQELTVYP